MAQKKGEVTIEHSRDLENLAKWGQFHLWSSWQLGALWGSGTRVLGMSLPAILFEVSLKYVLMVCLLTSWLQVAPLKPSLLKEGGDIVSEHLLWWYLDSREQRQELAARVLEGACRRLPISCKGDPYPQSKRNTVVAAAALKEALEETGALVRALPFFVYVTLGWKYTISQLQTSVLLQ